MVIYSRQTLRTCFFLTEALRTCWLLMIVEYMRNMGALQDKKMQIFDQPPQLMALLLVY